MTLSKSNIMSQVIFYSTGEDIESLTNFSRLCIKNKNNEKPVSRLNHTNSIKLWDLNHIRIDNDFLKQENHNYYVGSDCNNINSFPNQSYHHHKIRGKDIKEKNCSKYTSFLDLVGDNNQEWKNILKNLRQKDIKFSIPDGINMEDYPELILQKNNRLNCPIYLNPQKATFIDVAIHGKLRQRLSNSTIEKHLRYARFMETHSCPVDLRKPNFDNFIRHMDWREQIENASPHALAHEWKAMLMFLKAYGLKISEWPYKPPSAPKSHIRILPYPETVRRFFTCKYCENKYERALYQYMFFFGFMVGVRPPSEICEMKTTDVHFESKNRGYIVITETKKHYSQRAIIPDKAILTSKVHKSLKNWLKSWRPKIVNQHSGDVLFLQPDGKPFNVRYLGNKLSEHGKKVWRNFSPYDMRHWSAVARLIRAKCETGEWDCYTVKNWLGHETMSTTEGYIKYAEQYYKSLPVDWISCALKSMPDKTMTGLHKNKIYKREVQQTAILGPVDTLPSCYQKWARRDLNS